MQIANFNTKNKVLIIAELSANHNNDLALAKETIHAMYESGADCLKLQTYTANSLTIDADTSYFQPLAQGLWKGRTPYEVFKQAALPYGWHEELFELANSLGMICFSSPFDKEGVDLLEKLNVPAYKIASFEIHDIPLIEYVASKKKPIIISTGIAKLSDIELALETCRSQNNNQIVLLKCTSAYPTPLLDVNLKTINNLERIFAVEVGLSDHTMGHSVSLGAIALGATVVEKHFVLDRSKGGVDASFSMEPLEFKEMVIAIRELEKALGNEKYELSEKQIESSKRGRTIFAFKDIRNNDIFTHENIKTTRSHGGLHPKEFKSILGKKSMTNIKKGHPITWSLINEES